MKIGVIPENIFERIALTLGYVPTPLIEIGSNIIFVRALMVATKLNLFEALASEPLSTKEVAARCGTHPEATQKLLNALVAMDYLGKDRELYALTHVARKWLLKGVQHSLYDFVVYEFVDWEWVTHMEDFIRTGKPVLMHEQMSSEDWKLYQYGMQSIANIVAPQVAKHTPVPKGARNMLDIGGSHGCYCVEICRRYPKLNAIILDLPKAVEFAAPLLAKAGMGNRVIHKAGNALTDDLGTDLYDLILISNLAHHFDEDTNRKLIQRTAQALKPGGYLVIQEYVMTNPNSPNKSGQMLVGLWNLFYALTSGSRIWNFEKIVSWQQEAGLIPKKPISLLQTCAQQSAMKPSR
jgi:2-polyprenyl-3-methyl-5-hydroxy-6-metoxy-1,4-benzoquinol methylase